MSQVAQSQIDRSVLALRVAAWFLIGLVISVALVVVSPPLIVPLLLALSGTTIALRLRRGRFSQRLASMLLGVVALSLYTLTWMLTTGR